MGGQEPPIQLDMTSSRAQTRATGWPGLRPAMEMIKEDARNARSSLPHCESLLCVLRGSACNSLVTPLARQVSERSTRARLSDGGVPVVIVDTPVANEVCHHLEVAGREARGDARAFRIQ